MATLIPFQPNNKAAPPFQVPVTLDGVSYSMQTTANFYAANRWYVSLYDQSGNLVMNMPLIGSPLGFNIYLFPGLFRTSTILYRVISANSGIFEVTP